MTQSLISIVDDDESFCRAMSALLRSLGHSVAAYGSAEEFLESGRLGQTHCLISDVHMRGMSGLDLQHQLAAAGHRFPLIFVSADPQAKARSQALAAGALAFLNKPFQEEALISCLEQALSGR